MPINPTKKQSKKTDTSTNSPTYYGYDLEHQGYVEVTRQANPHEEYDGDDTRTDWTISDNLVENKTASADFCAPFEVKHNTNYYAVYVIYSTGDSFSSDENGRISFVELFKTKKKAQDLVHKIETEHNDKGPLSMDYLDEEGHKKTCSCDWNGYFEHIGVCEAKEVSFPSLKKKIRKML